MNNPIDRAAEAMFGDSARRTRNVKFYFRPDTTASQLADYHNRAMAQIAAGSSQPDVDSDGDSLD